MNLYGFASGDPVNFSDPFGLRPDTIPGEIQKKLGDMCQKIDRNAAEIVTEGTVHASVMRISGGRAVTLGNNIYLASAPDPNNAARMALVAHELAHVGQYQQWGSAAYYISAGVDRVKELVGLDPYHWRGTPGEFLNRYRGMEQGAQIVQDCFTGSSRACAISPYTFSNGGGK